MFIFKEWKVNQGHQYFLRSTVNIKYLHSHIPLRNALNDHVAIYSHMSTRLGDKEANLLILDNLSFSLLGGSDVCSDRHRPGHGGQW